MLVSVLLGVVWLVVGVEVMLVSVVLGVVWLVVGVEVMLGVV